MKEKEERWLWWEALYPHFAVWRQIVLRGPNVGSDISPDGRWREDDRPSDILVPSQLLLLSCWRICHSWFPFRGPTQITDEALCQIGQIKKKFNLILANLRCNCNVEISVSFCLCITQEITIWNFIRSRWNVCVIYIDVCQRHMGKGISFISRGESGVILKCYHSPHVANKKL